VVAIDRHNRPVRDLKESDFQIFEAAMHSQRTPRDLSAFHLIDPASPARRIDAPSAGFRVAPGGCATGETFHYELAYQPSPDGWTSGYHEILVTTSRPPRYPFVPSPLLHRQDRCACDHAHSADRCGCGSGIARGSLSPLANAFLHCARGPIGPVGKQRFPAILKSGSDWRTAHLLAQCGH
jgi:hypothetical protein